jgi:hypothetical protein
MDMIPMVVFIRQEPALSMQFSLYVTLGVFLLLAIRNPPASRSVIAFTAWSKFRSCCADGHPGMSQHGRTWRTDRGSCSCDHRRRLNRARAIKGASGASVTPEPTPFTLTRSRRTVEAVGLLIQRSFYQEQGVLGIAPRTVGDGNAAVSRNLVTVL